MFYVVFFLFAFFIRSSSLLTLLILCFSFLIEIFISISALFSSFLHLYFWFIIWFFSYHLYLFFLRKTLYYRFHTLETYLYLPSAILPYHFLFFLRTTILFSPSYPFIVFCCYSSPALSLGLFSHSPHSHASPSTVFTLPHASSFPFSRFSLHLFRPICCLALWTLSLSPSLSLSLSFFLYRSFSHVTWSYIFVLLFGIASIHLSFPLFSSRFTLIDRDRTSRCRRRGWTRTDWWRLSSAARGCKKRGVANHVVEGASIVTVLNKQP